VSEREVAKFPEAGREGIVSSLGIRVIQRPNLGLLVLLDSKSDSAER
jgi:hypothetical protein